ncbi:PREDICTED: basic salivary proline-rich protein 1-like [Dipodomys ordii]|uniref:Basic salivary proline-rich protein 1-like n=1 Tax=Dipodomys ordii TaxID=10020 RepID=A0A1S3FN97_DIPOR|nr:PREDICTED: basic salivary proline-rich protein 1-like [Dipodomys ordii]
MTSRDPTWPALRPRSPAQPREAPAALEHAQIKRGVGRCPVQAHTAPQQPREEVDEKMPLSPPPQGDPREPSPSKAPKKHGSFHLWRPKKKQPPPLSQCGVFVPHPAPVGEARALDVLDGSQQEPQEFPLHCGEPQVCHSTGEVSAPTPADSTLMKKSRAQPPEDNRKKPVLGKLGTLFTAGRRRNTRSGPEGSTSSNTKPASPRDVTSSNAPERDSEKSKCENHQPKPPDPREDSSSQETQGEGCVLATSGDAAEMSPGSPSAAAGQPSPDSDSPQLEPLQAEGEPFPDATTAAKQPHSSAPNRSGQESAEAHARRPGEDAPPDAGHPQQTARASEAASGSPTRERPVEGRGEVPEGAPHAGACSDPQPPEDASGPRSGPPTPGERAHPSKALTLDIYLSKTEVVPVDEPVGIAAPGAEEDFGDSDDMDKKSSGRRSGRRRRSQKSTDSPGADAAGPPESGARDDAVFDDEWPLKPDYLIDLLMTK